MIKPYYCITTMWKDGKEQDHEQQYPDFESAKAIADYYMNENQSIIYSNIYLVGPELIMTIGNNP